MTKEVNPVLAWIIIIVVAVFAAYLCYNAGVHYYADKTAMYESQAKASELELKVETQKKIGTGIIIKK